MAEDAKHELDLDIDSAMAVDEEMQGEIDKLKADPWELLPAKDGFKPLDLLPDAEEGTPEHEKGYRDRWSQNEFAEIEDAGLRELTNRDTKANEGHIAFIQLRATRGPNKDKRIEQSWWLRTGDRDAIRDMNASLQELFSKLKIKPKLVKKNGNMVPSYVGSLEMLKKRPVKFRLQQKWDYPYKQDQTGQWQPQTDEPKRFKKKLYSVGPA